MAENVELEAHDLNIVERKAAEVLKDELGEAIKESEEEIQKCNLRVLRLKNAAIELLVSEIDRNQKEGPRLIDAKERNYGDGEDRDMLTVVSIWSSRYSFVDKAIAG
ncbi:hypothetical protein NL676_035454 [Syzygium grande]|nr:hypothetical protein NL676_035454 [Syzygium grande]